MKSALEDTDITHSIFVELKHLGVKVPKVRKFKSRVPKQEKHTGKLKNKIFGIHLSEQEWVTSPDGPLPKFMFDSTRFLLKHSKEVGLFRKAGSIARQRNLRVKLEDGEGLEGSDANDVASLFKQWLRELPEPLIPHYMQDLFLKCHQVDNVNRTAAILLSALLLPSEHLHVLKCLLRFLDKFSADCNENKMGTFNLALMMAPNIFVPSSEAPDKSSNNLVQIHAATIELLIHNAGKVGEVPSSLSIQSSIQDWKSADELDSSGDFLDSSPSKSKKKQKVGQGQLLELFSGIKKLVGQNTTPSANKLTPEKHHNTRINSPHCAAKRKAELDQQALTSKKLAAASALENRLNFTPKASDCNLNGGKSAERHARRKSFGLLRRKERKRQKSCKASLQSQINVTKSHAQNLNNTSVSKESTLQISSISSEFRTEPLSPLQCSFEDLLKTVNMKKAASDCYLTPKMKMFSESPKPISVSHSRLYERPVISSPYWLRSEKTQDIITVSVHSPDKSADVQDSSSKENNTSLQDGNKNISLSFENLNDASKAFQEPGPCSMLSDSLYELSPAFRKRSFSTGSKLIRKAAITRQEGFIMKAKPHFIYDDSENYSKEESINLGKTNPKDLKEGSSVILLTSKSRRQGSIVRGRPNSVKSGLVSQSLKSKGDSHGSEPVVESNSLLDKNIPDIKNDDSTSKQCLSLNDEVLGQHLEKHDLSLVTKFDNFSLSPNSVGTSLLEENSTSCSPSFESKFERGEQKRRSSRRKSTRSAQKQKRKMSLPSNLAVPNSGKVRKTRNSDVSSVNSDFPLESEKPQEISNLDSSDCFKLPLPSKNSTFNMSNIDCHMDDSCFKTPTQNPSGSPSSITWVSGSKFFGLNSPEDDDNFNKRESIALILKNKQGNVQEKVNLYDTRVRDSVYCTRRVQNCSTPYIAFSRNDPRRGTTSSQKRHHTPLSRAPGSINQDKATKSKVTSHKSLPPPPKFMVSELEMPSPKTNLPLKEVTNTSLNLNESRDNTPVKKGTDSPDPEVALKEKKRASQKRKKMTGRSSYPEQTHTQIKGVSRSESSPCRRRVSKTKSAGIRESACSPSVR